MPNTPYNANRKVATFGDYCHNIDAEEEELKRIKRGTTKNDVEMHQIPGNPKVKYNRVTHKNDELSPAEVNDKIEAIEEMEESMVIEKKLPLMNVEPDFLKWLKKLKKEIYADKPGKQWNNSRELIEHIIDKAKERF